MNREHVDEFEVAGLTVSIDYDQDAESPREWDNLGTMICWHRRHNLGDLHGKSNPYDSPSEFQEWADSSESHIAVILPLYLYDHSGITMSCGPFACPWDSGQVGYIYITREKCLSEYGYKRLTKKRLAKIAGYLKQEVATYDEWLTGQVYGFTVEDLDGEHIDSCWGFYGLDYCKQEATNSAQSAAEHIAQRETEVAKLLNTGFAL